MHLILHHFLLVSFEIIKRSFIFAFIDMKVSKNRKVLLKDMSIKERKTK